MSGEAERCPAVVAAPEQAPSARRVPSAAAAHPSSDLPDGVLRMIPITDYGLIQEILSSRDFTLAGREHSRPFLLRTLPLTEAAEHSARRRLEAPLFRPGVLATRHAQTVDDAVNAMLATLFADTADTAVVDLVPFVFSVETLIMAKFVGIELPADELSVVEDITERMRHVSDGASLVWSRNDPIDDAWRIRRQLLAFEETYLLPAIKRAFSRDRSQPPQTLIETLVDGYDRSRWDGELIARESWAFMAGGVQTSLYTILDALPLLMGWLDDHPGGRTRVLDRSSDFILRVVAESLRLNVPNPAIFRVALRSGTTPSGFAYEEGEEFSLYTGVADRDTAYFGDDAADFDPDRVMKEGIPRWGFAFGQGHHACIGRALALGRRPDGSDSTFEGSTVSILRALVACEVEYVDGDSPAYRDDTFKAAFKRFPVRLRRSGLAGSELPADSRGGPGR
jgi:cytochrome P450